MRTILYTDDLIIEAGIALVDAGIRVTGWELRKRVGGGNLDRLMSVWLEYDRKRAEHAEPEMAPPVIELPAELSAHSADTLAAITTTLAAVYTECWSAAVNVASSRIAAERAEIAVERAEHAEYRLQTCAALDAADEALAARDDQIAVLIDAIEVRDNQIAALQADKDREIAQLQSRIGALEALSLIHI